MADIVAKDLMIGNYVYVRGDNTHPFTVGGIEKSGNLWIVYLEEAKKWYEESWLEPIELTAEMLVDSKFGGEYHDDYYDGDIELLLEFNNWPAEEINERLGRAYTVSGYGTEIRYVHQLQNALNNCGKSYEIKIK